MTYIISALQKFVGVVSEILNISNMQSAGQAQRNRSQTQSEDAGTSLLITMDKFALRSFNASLGLIMEDNLSKLIGNVSCVYISIYM